MLAFVAVAVVMANTDQSRGQHRPPRRPAARAVRVHAGARVAGTQGASVAPQALGAPGAPGTRGAATLAAGRRPKAQFAQAAIGVWGPGSWCWFADPRAVRVASPRNMTFAGWIDWTGHVTVGAYDAASGATGTYVLGSMFPDDHSSPTILVNPNRTLTVFWSGHDGSAIFYRTTLRPEAIDAWGPVQTVPAHIPGDLGFTYPDPDILSAEHNQLYLFWRGATWSTNYIVRRANGHWSRARGLVTNPGQRPYVKIDSNGSDTIAFAFTNAHPRNALTSVYYMAYRQGWLRHANGRLIRRLNGRALRPAQADVVYNARTTGISSWVWDVALGSGGHPVVVYATFPSPSNDAYWYARWNGRRWVSHFLTFGGPTISPGTIEYEYSGGLALDHSDPSVVYLSRKVHGWFEIERWVTPDGGHRWSHTTVVRTPGADDVRPVITRGADGGPMTLLWLGGHYGTYTSYRTSVQYLW